MPACRTSQSRSGHGHDLVRPDPQGGNAKAPPGLVRLAKGWPLVPAAEPGSQGNPALMGSPPQRCLSFPRCRTQALTFPRAAVRLPRDGPGPDARRAWPVTKMHRPQLQAFPALPGGDGRGSRRRLAFWGPVPRAGGRPAE